MPDSHERPDEFRHEDHDDDQDQPPRSGGGCGKMLAIGCVVFLVLAIGGLVAIYLNRVKIGVTVTKMLASKAISAAQLEPDQQERILAVVESVGDDLVNERITLEQIVEVLEEARPALAGAGVKFVAKVHLEPSGLSTEEQAAGLRTMQRFARGLVDGTIELKEPRELGGPFRNMDPKRNSYDLEPKLTDAELREFLAGLKVKADAAQILDEPFEIDIAATLERALEKVRSSLPAPEGTEEPAVTPK